MNNSIRQKSIENTTSQESSSFWDWLPASGYQMPKKRKTLSGRKRDCASLRIVYVMAPLVMYDTKPFADRKLFLQDQLPGACFLYPDRLFESNADWLEKIDGIVTSCECGILTSPKNRIVGKGCFFEVELLKKAGKPVFYLDYAKKVLTREFLLCKLLGDDWINYALVEFSHKIRKNIAARSLKQSRNLEKLLK